MDQQVQQLERQQQEVKHCGENCLTEYDAASEKMTCIGCEHSCGDSKTVASESSTAVGDRCSASTDVLYANGVTRLTDSVSSCEQTRSLLVMENGDVTVHEAVDISPPHLHQCDSETTGSATGTIDSATKQVISSKESAVEWNRQSSVNSEDCAVLHCVTDDTAAETEGTDVKVKRCVEMPHVESTAPVCHGKVQQNAKQDEPLDFSMAALAKTGVAATRKTLVDDVQKAHPKHDLKSDKHRPVGRLVHDIGLELVREQVYRDLIDIQTAKDAKNRLEEHEKGQLLKLIEAQERLALRNAPYQLPMKRCRRCNFVSPITNVMRLHHEIGTVSRVDATLHVCCLCTTQPGFRTRNSGQFMLHLSTAHGLTGRLVKKVAPYACKNCVFEHRSSVRFTIHIDKCAKKFSLSTNLQPLPGDCDIPLMYGPSDQKRQGTSPHMQTGASYNASPSTNGPQSVKSMLRSLRQQISAGQPGYSYNQLAMTSLICEICGKLVDGREALWAHFRSAHHVELSHTTMRDKEPWMKCDVCSGQFWTYQGLSRHLLLAHNRALANSFTSPGTPVSPAVVHCHLCGGSQTSNPLSHFSAYHNVTLLEMYHAKLCCLCNRKVNSGRAFEEHMVEQHSNIFANYDVLRTVLQALTAARYFKADDTREPTTQHIMQLSARSPNNSSDAPSQSHVRNKFPDSSQTASGQSSNAATDVTDKKSPTAVSRTLHRKHSSSGVVSPHSGQKKRPNTDMSVMKHKCSKSGCSCATETHTSESQMSPVKANDKGATVEEVKKLYEDLADIGRPILRSMRRKLSSNSEVKYDESKLNISDQNSSINDAQEVHARLQSSDKVCNDKIDYN